MKYDEIYVAVSILLTSIYWLIVIASIVYLIK